MDLHLSLLPLCALAASAINIFVALLSWQRRTRRGGWPLALLMLALVIWQLANGLELASVSLVDKIFWSKVSYIGIASAPLLFFAFALYYTERERWLTPFRQSLMVIIPIISILMAFTNENHWLLWSHYSYNAQTNLVIYTHGPWFWINILYAYLLMVFSTTMLVASAIRHRRVYRRQFFVILASMTITWFGNLAYVAGWIPVKGFDPTPWTFGLTGVLFLWGILWLDLFDIVPTARQQVIERMQDGLVILDESNRIIDVNPAANIILVRAQSDAEVLTVSRMYGQPLVRVMAGVPGFAARLRGNADSAGMVTIGPPRSQRIYDVQVSPLAGFAGHIMGRSVMFHDVTEYRHMAEAEARARELAEALQEIGVAVTSTLNYDRVLDQILAYLRRLISVDSCNILLLENSQLRIVAVNGLDPEAMVGFYIPYSDEYPNKEIIEKRQVVNLPDAQAKYPVFRQTIHRRIRSWMGAPLTVKNTVIGTLNLDSEEINHFSPTDERIVRAFASQAAIAIDNSRLYTEAQRNAVEQEVLNEIFQTISMKLELPELLGVVQRQVRRFIDFDLFQVATYQPLGDKWEAFYQIGLQGEFIQSTVKPTGGLTGYIIRERQPLLLASLVDLDALIERTGTLTTGAPPRSFMGVPLVVADKLVGVMSAEHHTREYVFHSDDLRLFGMIGSQVAIAIENARLFAETKSLAITDGLTGLHTRRHFFSQAEKAIQHATRYNEPVSALMIDLDHFKMINDTHGHAVGDVVLQTVARLCQQALRDADIIGRYGGEEIAVVMPQTRLDQACQVAERLRSVIERYSGGVPVTISVGVSVMNPDDPNLEIVLNQADRALYSAKQTGRNRVCAYS
jgi:diguanylate cyclase (GGDEF)-like protein